LIDAYTKHNNIKELDGSEVLHKVDDKDVKAPSRFRKIWSLLGLKLK